MKPEPPLDPSKPEMETRAAAAAQPMATPGPVDSSGTAVSGEHAQVARARAGDRAAFAWLVDRHRDRAYTLALRIVGVPAEAEEVAQDAFVRVWRALPGFRGEAAFTTWLHRIVVRVAFDRAALLRHRRAREAPFEAAPEPADRRPVGPDAHAHAARRRLERLMDTLSETQRAAVTLYYLADRSVEEVAATLGLPVNTVKTHLSRARAALRAGWDREEPS